MPFLATCHACELFYCTILLFVSVWVANKALSLSLSSKRRLSYSSVIHFHSWVTATAIAYTACIFTLLWSTRRPEPVLPSKSSRHSHVVVESPTELLASFHKAPRGWVTCSQITVSIKSKHPQPLILLLLLPMMMIYLNDNTISVRWWWTAKWESPVISWASRTISVVNHCCCCGSSDLLQRIGSRTSTVIRL